MPVIDGLKAVASQLIVLHHLAFYGPMSEAAASVAPSVIGGLADHGRLAVQVFLVTGGFLSARAIQSSFGSGGNPAPAPAPARDSAARASAARDGAASARDGMARAQGAARTTSSGARGFVIALRLLLRRYRRLALPFICAVTISIAAAALARALADDASTPSAPGLLQFLAHALLLHDVLDFEALQAGSWYVAIDLQLFGAMLLALLVGQRLGTPWIPALLLALASLFVFNRDPQWDVWAPYFFGSYALGAFAWQAVDRRAPTGPFAILVLATVAALAIDFRVRIAVALAVALLLVGAGRRGSMLPTPGDVAIGPIGLAASALGRISFSVFLIHYPVLLVVNAVFARYAGGEPAIGLAGMSIAWAASIAAGALFHGLIERRFG